PTDVHCLPSNELWPCTEQYDHLPVTRSTSSQSCVNAPTVSTAANERGRRRAKCTTAVPPNLPGFSTTCLISPDAAYEGIVRQSGLDGRDHHLVGNLNRPYCASDPRELCDGRNLLVAKELGPGSVGCIGQILDGPFIGTMPTC